MLQIFVSFFHNIIKNKDLKNISISLIIKSLGLVLSFSLNIILINSIGIESYGEYIFYISLISYFSMIATFGIDVTSLKLLTRYHSLKNHLGFISTLNKNLKKVFILSILVVVTLFSLKIFFNSVINIKTYLFFCSLVLIPLKSISSIYYSAIRAVEKPNVYLCLELIVRKLLLIFPLLLIKKLNWIDADTFHIFCLTAVIYSVIIIFSNLYVNGNLNLKQNNQESIIKNFNQRNISLYIFFIQSISLFNLNIDYIFIEYFLDTKNISYYKISSQIVMISGFTLNAINVFLAPMITKLYFKNKIKDLQKKLTLISKLNLISGIFSILFIVSFGKYLLFLHDESMIQFYPIVLILLAGTTFHVFCGSVYHLMIMTKMEKVAAILILISALINFSCNFLLIPKYGLIGCAISTTLSIIFYNMFSVFFIIKKIRLNPSVLTIFA